MNINPVLLKELKVRMRGWRAAAILALYLLILTIVAAVIIYSIFTNPYSSSIDPDVSIGAYTGLAVIQFILILFIVPSLTSGAISGEREKQTLDLVLCTRLRPISIVIGKLFASVGQVLLLIVSSLPLFSMVFLFGGISIKEILQLFGFYMVTAIAIGCIGIFFSTFLKRTTAATVLTYGTVAFLLFGTMFITIVYMSIFNQRDYQGILPVLYTNPLVGFSSILAEQFGYYRGGLGIIPGIFGVNTGNNQGILNAFAPWMVNVIFDGMLSAVLVLLSAVKINPVRGNLLESLKARRKSKK